MSFNRSGLFFFATTLAVLFCGCPSSGPSGPSTSVTVYCAADRELSQGVLDRFEKEAGIKVDAKWDTESTKTVGLAQAIEQESARPRADVFWDNEPLQVVLLARSGRLAPLPKEVLDAAGQAPRDPEGRWLGFSARVRVLIVNTNVVPADARPTSIKDLAMQKWKGKVGIANPLFGSTASHVAALFAKLGEKDARAFFESLKEDQIAICAGNSDVKNRVASGELAFGLTDTDDAWSALEDKKPVTVVFPDQGANDMGTLVMPNALALVAGSPHPDSAAKLVKFLASASVENDLAKGAGQQIPLLPGGEKSRPSWIPEKIKTLDVTWNALADAHPKAREATKSILLAEK